LIISSILGACTTYYLSISKQQGPVRASAILSLIVAGFFYIYPQLLSEYLTQNIPLIFIGGSFIGMVSSAQMSSYIGLSIAGLLFAVIYLNTSQFFAGYGGALGTSACISLLVVLSIPHFKSKRRLTVGLLQLRRFVLKNKKRG